MMCISVFVCDIFMPSFASPNAFWFGAHCPTIFIPCTPWTGSSFMLYTPFLTLVQTDTHAPGCSFGMNESCALVMHHAHNKKHTAGIQIAHTCNMTY